MGITGNFSLDLYREHLKVRQILILGVIDDAMIEKVTLQILKFNEQDEDRERVDRTYDRMANPITLKIASPGGYLDAGLSIVSQIMQSQTPVIGYAIGDVASMATTILSVCHARIASKFSRIMVHSVAGGRMGKVQELRDWMEYVEKEQKMLDELLISRTNLTQKILDDIHIKQRDHYFSAEEALEFGIVDEVMSDGLKIDLSKKKKPTAKTAKKQ